MREIRQSGSEGGARFNPLSLPLSVLRDPAVVVLTRCAHRLEAAWMWLLPGLRPALLCWDLPVALQPEGWPRGGTDQMRLNQNTGLNEPRLRVSAKL